MAGFGRGPVYAPPAECAASAECDATITADEACAGISGGRSLGGGGGFQFKKAGQRSLVLFAQG